MTSRVVIGLLKNVACDIDPTHVIVTRQKLEEGNHGGFSFESWVFKSRKQMRETRGERERPASIIGRRPTSCEGLLCGFVCCCLLMALLSNAGYKRV